MSFDQHIVQVVNASLVDEFEMEPEALKPEARLVTDLGMDSLDLMDMVLLLQNAFGVELREEKRIREVRTLADLYTLIGVIKQEMNA